MAGRPGLSSCELIDNVIPAQSSNGMIAPTYSDDPKSGNSYLLTVQSAAAQVKSFNDLQQIPSDLAMERRSRTSELLLQWTTTSCDPSSAD